MFFGFTVSFVCDIKVSTLLVLELRVASEFFLFSMFDWPQQVRKIATMTIETCLFMIFLSGVQRSGFGDPAERDRSWRYSVLREAESRSCGTE
jgi:hypothetical protein